MRLYALATQFTAVLAFFIVTGVVVDRYWKVAPWGVFGFGAAGLALALYDLVRKTQPPKRGV